MIAPRLFTPGPLTTSASVRAVMDRDVGSRDDEFIAVVQTLRAALTDLVAPGHPDRYATVLVPGSGTYAVEAMIGTCVPDRGHLIIASNGAYGERMRAIAERLAVPHSVLRVPEHQALSPAGLAAAVDARPETTHVALVHCETTTGILNPLAALAEVTRRDGIVLLVDAMSSFGALPIDMAALGVQCVAASSNKCLEGVPGLAFVVADRRLLQTCRGQARSVSLDLSAQLDALDRDGQCRFTPPTHVVLALAQALVELQAEGGVAARRARYAANQRRLVQEMATLGIEPYLAVELQGPVITTFCCPSVPEFDFATFYQKLHRRGFVIYPGKLTTADTFRVGSIGQLFESDMVALAAAMGEVLHEMGVELART